MSSQVISSQLSDFQLLSKLGQGLYSTVYKVRRLSDNQVYALKQVKLLEMPSKQVQNAINQIRILASIKHSNVIGYREAFYDQFSKLLWYVAQISINIVMQYADGGDLSQKIQDHRNRGSYFKQSQIWDMFSMMAAGITQLHQLGILHRDIKSANFYLMRNGTIKIGDMNVSKVIRKTGMCQTQTGAPYYASPQVWKQQAYDTKSDMWSFGCVLYELINLKLPFKARDMEGLFKKVTRGYYSRINKSYSDDLSDLLKYLINVNPKERKYCKQLMQMPFVKRNIRRHKDQQSEQKSILLKTIKLNKNLTYMNSSLPKPNYSPMKIRCESLHRSLIIQKSHSVNEIKKNSSTLNSINSSSVKLQKISPTVKLSLPPLSSTFLEKRQKAKLHPQRSGNMPEQKKMEERNIYSQKQSPRYRYKKARSYMNKY